VKQLWVGSAALATFMAAASASHAVEISFWTNLTTASQANVIQKQINECVGSQQGLAVKFETVPFGAMYTRLITALRKGDPPNIMNTIEGAVAFRAGQRRFGAGDRYR